jgi:hypothetical protein
MSSNSSIEDIDARYKALLKRRDEVQKNKLLLEAELGTRKRALKEAMEECKKAGFNPDNLPEEIQRAKEVLAIKLDNLSADLDAAESIMKPMLKEIG